MRAAGAASSFCASTPSGSAPRHDRQSPCTATCCIERHLIGPVAAAPEPVAVAGLVDGDPIDPGAKARLSAEPVDRAETPAGTLPARDRAPLRDRRAGWSPAARPSAGVRRPARRRPLRRRWHSAARAPPRGRRRRASWRRAPASPRDPQMTCRTGYDSFHYSMDRAPANTLPVRPRRGAKVPAYDRRHVKTALFVARRAGPGRGRPSRSLTRRPHGIATTGPARPRATRPLRDDQTFGAIEAYSGAIALRPESMLAHLRRGETYRRAGRARGSRARLPRGRSARPDRHATARGAGRRPVRTEAVRPRGRDLRPRICALDDRVRRRELQAGARPLSRRQSRRRAHGARRDACVSTIGWPTRYYLLRPLPPRQAPNRRGARGARTGRRDRPGLDPGARRACGPVRRRSAGAAKRSNSCRCIAGLDRDHVERQIAVGLAHARAPATSEDGSPC